MRAAVKRGLQASFLHLHSSLSVKPFKILLSEFSVRIVVYCLELSDFEAVNLISIIISVRQDLSF